LSLYSWLFILIRYSDFCLLCSFQGSPCEDRNFRSDVDDNETEEASFSGQEDLNDLNDILEWAKVCSLTSTYICFCLFSHHSLLYFVADGNLSISQKNNHGPLQIISQYYRLSYPARGSSLTFHPLEHLHPLEYKRSAESFLRLAGSTVVLKTHSTGLELVDVCYHHNFLVEEYASIALQI